ncbi:hypothetical protein FQA39_LY01541 [Lamprigera yunnana]|nr:hypothetical protein FQA39_LY01541 [Lamprigera yunnana]
MELYGLTKEINLFNPIAINIDRRRYTIDTAREALQKMLDDEGETDLRDHQDDDIEEDDSVEIEELQDACIIEIKFG